MIIHPRYFEKAGAPDVNDDSSKAYRAGDIIQDTSGGEVHVCTSAAVGAATWALVQAAEITFINGVTAGTAAASKALVLDASLDIATIHDVTMNGNLSFTGATGLNLITLVTNLADALSVVDSAGDLIVFDTTTGSQKITITPTLTVTGGVQSSAAAVTSTADGLTTGLIPSGAAVVSVTSADANNIITLPTAVAGTRIMIITGGTGCEIRTPAASNDTINNVDSDGTNELALAASSTFEAVATSATAWVIRGWNNLGADLAALVPDAA